MTDWTQEREATVKEHARWMRVNGYFTSGVALDDALNEIKRQREENAKLNKDLDDIARQRDALTLIELLVVISIMALLMST